MDKRVRVAALPEGAAEVQTGVGITCIDERVDRCSSKQACLWARDPPASTTGHAGESPREPTCRVFERHCGEGGIRQKTLGWGAARVWLTVEEEDTEYSSEATIRFCGLAHDVPSMTAIDGEHGAETDPCRCTRIAGQLTSQVE